MGILPSVTLYDAAGTAMDVSDGVAVPAGTKTLLFGGVDGSDVARPLGLDPSGALPQLPLGIGIHSGAFPNVSAPGESLPPDIAGGWTATNTAFGGHLSRGAAANSQNFPNYAITTSNAAATLASSSASDTAAGVGARQVKIWYYDAAGDGPFTTTVTLNGTTGVTTGVSNIAAIWYCQVVSAGSTGWNVGNITFSAPTTYAPRIFATDNRSFSAHTCGPASVAGGKYTYVTGVRLSCTGNSGIITLMGTRRIVTGRDFTAVPVTALAPPFRVVTGQNPVAVTFEYPLRVEVGGLAYLTVQPDSTTAGTYYGSIDFFLGDL